MALCPRGTRCGFFARTHLGLEEPNLVLSSGKLVSQNKFLTRPALKRCQTSTCGSSSDSDRAPKRSLSSMAVLSLSVWDKMETFATLVAFSVDFPAFSSSSVI